MTIIEPYVLLLLLLIPLLIAVYVWLQRRKRKFAIRYASLSLIREALPLKKRWRQHLPFGLFLFSIASLIIALSRPQALLEVPLSRTTIILALDVSRSMCATDVEPNRLTVAQEAARTFIEEQVDGTRIAIVAFAGFAELTVPPTTDKEKLSKAINSFTTSRGTAIGSATLKSIDAIAEINTDVAPSNVNLSEKVERKLLSQSEEYVPDIIVLLTDGANSQGIDPIRAAEQAVDRRVRIYTIGFGTNNPVAFGCTPEQLGGDILAEFGRDRFGGGGGGGAFGGGGFGGIRQFLVIDEPTLQSIAEMTGGTYNRAENAAQLLDIFLNLPTQFILQKENFELSVIFTALGALFATLAIGLSLLWNRYP